jgi:hypothetical protein
MTRTPAVALLAALAALGPGPPARAQDPAAVDALGRFAFQTHVFRRLLFDQGLEPLAGFGPLAAAPEQSLLIVLGQTDCLSPANLPGGLAGFLEQGGAALVATDRPVVGAAHSQLAEAAGVEVVGRSFLGPRDEPELLYRGKAFCPLLVPVAGAEPDLFRGPRLDPTARLRVAANVPAGLRQVRRVPGMHRLAELPAGSSPEGLPRGRFTRLLPGLRLADPGPLFAVGGRRGEGRLLVLADHSLFINEMMLPGDTGNLEFAYNCLEWLREGPARRRVLLVEEGIIRTDLQVPLREVEIPLEVQAALADRVLAHLEQENTFNRAAWDWLWHQAGGRSSRLARWALEACTILLLAYAAYRVGIRSRLRTEPLVPLLAHAAARQAPAQPLLEQRYQAVHQAGNHWETAHHLARTWFARLVPAAGASGRAPQLRVSGSWLARWGLGRRLARAWRLARGEAPARVGPRRLRRLLRDLEVLQAALDDGTARLQESTETRP